MRAASMGFSLARLNKERKSGLTSKAKVAAGVKSSHLELQRLRQMSDLSRRLVSAIQMEKVGYEENSAEITKAKKSKAEADMFQADLAYPQALARLKTLMGKPESVSSSLATATDIRKP